MNCPTPLHCTFESTRQARGILCQGQQGNSGTAGGVYGLEARHLGTGQVKVVGTHTELVTAVKTGAEISGL